MQTTRLEHYRKILSDLRDRLTGDVNYVVESVQEEINQAGNLSGMPIHLADAATESLDAEVQVLEAEYGMLDDISAALGRIDNGTFGTCLECGEDISRERLDAIPYTPRCIGCARAKDELETGAAGE